MFNARLGKIGAKKFEFEGNDAKWNMTDTRQFLLSKSDGPYRVRGSADDVGGPLASGKWSLPLVLTNDAAFLRGTRLTGLPDRLPVADLTADRRWQLYADMRPHMADASDEAKDIHFAQAPDPRAVHKQSGGTVGDRPRKKFKA